MRFFFLFFFTFLYAKEILVAASANTSYVLPQIVKSFEKKYHQKVKVVFSSSGKLSALIMHKAPFSIFLSADMKYPMKIYKLNLSLTKPKVYARGGIVLFSRKDISLLDAKKIATANPRVAPYGKAAVEAFKSMNIYDKIKNKLVFAPTVSSVALYVDRGVDIGVIAKSMQVNGIKKDLKGYNPIKQGVVLLKEDAREFYDFLFSKEARDIFRRYGYLE